MLENFWWGSVFLINLPIIALVLIAGPILIPESHGNTANPIDLVSSLLSLVAIVPRAHAIKRWVGSGLDWFVPVAAVVGLIAGWIFVRRQLRLVHPLLDVTLFRGPAFAGTRHFPGRHRVGNRNTDHAFV